MKLSVVALVIAGVLLREAFAYHSDYNVALKARETNKYWTRRPESSTLVNYITLFSSTKNQDTTFTRQAAINGKTKFWSPSAQAYLCRVSRGDADYIEAVPGQDDSRCRFTANNNAGGPGTVTIRADNGKYLCPVRIGSTDFIRAEYSSPCNFDQEVLHQF